MKTNTKNTRPTKPNHDEAVTEQLQRFRQLVETLGEKFLKLMADYDDVLCYMKDELQIYNDDIGLYSDIHKSSKLTLGLLALEGLGPMRSTGNRLDALPRLLGHTFKPSGLFMVDIPDEDIPF